VHGEGDLHAQPNYSSIIHKEHQTMLSTSNKSKFQYQYLLIAVVILAMVSAIALYQTGFLPAISTGQQASVAADLSWPPRPDFSQLHEIAMIPVTGSVESLAAYHSGGWGGPVAVQNGLDIYHQSERVQATLANRYEAGLTQYYLSERGTFAAAQNGMNIYHQSERNTIQVPTFNYGPPGR
jgi:hypothetical protein